MSKEPADVTENNGHPPSDNESRSETSLDKGKLTLSLSENTLDNQHSIKHKVLAKVKSWSFKDQQQSKDKCICVELDLARSLSRLEVDVSNEDVYSNLQSARDSLDNLLKDEQNTPKTSLEKTFFHTKPRSVPDSPKSSPQLSEKCKVSSLKTPLWDSFDRHEKKNRKDIKRKCKHKNPDAPKAEGRSISAEGRKTSIMKKHEDFQNRETSENSINDGGSLLYEKNSHQYKYFANNSKSVVFTNEVLVVYFNNEDVVGEEKEPLKWEVEQQSRNKKMRKGHLNSTQEKQNLCLF